MNTKEKHESRVLIFEKPLKVKTKSLRPMRSLVATRSFKPRTTVANMVMLKTEEMEKRD
jgi:hypothetical protein